MRENTRAILKGTYTRSLKRPERGGVQDGMRGIAAAGHLQNKA